MSIQENTQLLLRAFASETPGREEGFLAHFADDCRVTVVGTARLCSTYVGKREFAEKALRPSFKLLTAGIRFTCDSIFGEGDYVVMQSDGTAQTLDGLSTTTPISV